MTAADRRGHRREPERPAPPEFRNIFAAGEVPETPAAHAAEQRQQVIGEECGGFVESHLFQITDKFSTMLRDAGLPREAIGRLGDWAIELV